MYTPHLRCWVVIPALKFAKFMHRSPIDCNQLFKFIKRNKQKKGLWLESREMLQVSIVGVDWKGQW